MVDHTDVQVQLNDLEAEEARIMRELREIDEKARAESAATAGPSAAPLQTETNVDDPNAALTNLLAECEKEVRDSKGYIADYGPPMRIVRLRKGEVGPKTATYLSRPRNTGVDFTVPVLHKSYAQVVKNPIFLNDIRDKIRSRAYSHSDEYIADMRLLHRNTMMFNKGPDLEWVVQHARLLLEAAEEAVQSRSKAFNAIERSARQPPSSRQRPPTAAASKRKRTSDPPNTDRTSSGPTIGTTIEIWWGSPYRRWYPAVIVDRSGASEALVRYKSDDSSAWVTLHGGSCKWRMPVNKPLASSGASRPTSTRRADPPPGKKRRAAPVSPRSSPGVHVVADVDDPEAETSALRSAAIPQFDQALATMKEALREGLDRVESMVHRSDGLQRVLFAVQDAQDSMEAALSKVSKSVEQIRLNVRSMQRDVIDLKAVVGSDLRRKKLSRPEIIELDKASGEYTRRKGRDLDRDYHGAVRKERHVGRDYDRDQRRGDLRKGDDNRDRDQMRIDDGQRVRDDRDKWRRSKVDDRKRTPDDPMEIESKSPVQRDETRVIESPPRKRDRDSERHNVGTQREGKDSDGDTDGDKAVNGGKDRNGGRDIEMGILEDSAEKRQYDTYSNSDDDRNGVEAKIMKVELRNKDTSDAVDKEATDCSKDNKEGIGASGDVTPKDVHEEHMTDVRESKHSSESGESISSDEKRKSPERFKAKEHSSDNRDLRDEVVNDCSSGARENDKQDIKEEEKRSERVSDSDRDRSSGDDEDKITRVPEKGNMGEKSDSSGREDKFTDRRGISSSVHSPSSGRNAIETEEPTRDREYDRTDASRFNLNETPEKGKSSDKVQESGEGEIGDESSESSEHSEESSSESDGDHVKDHSKFHREEIEHEVKRASGVGSRPKVSRFAQAPEEDEGSTTDCKRDDEMDRPAEEPKSKDEKDNKSSHDVDGEAKDTGEMIGKNSARISSPNESA